MNGKLKIINITPDSLSIFIPWRIEKRCLGYDGFDNKYKNLIFSHITSESNNSKELNDWPTTIHGTIEICHLYKQETNCNYIRDNDNFSQLAIKGIIDGLKLSHIINDDVGTRLDLYFSSRFSNVDGTLIIIKRRKEYGREINIY